MEYRWQCPYCGHNEQKGIEGLVYRQKCPDCKQWYVLVKERQGYETYMRIFWDEGRFFRKNYITFVQRKRVKPQWLERLLNWMLYLTIGIFVSMFLWGIISFIWWILK